MEDYDPNGHLFCTKKSPHTVFIGMGGLGFKGFGSMSFGRVLVFLRHWTVNLSKDRILDLDVWTLNPFGESRSGWFFSLDTINTTKLNIFNSTS